jgi:membrane-associated protease RseP (regulator of RpoE activity)
VLTVGGVWYGRVTAPVGSTFSGEVGGAGDGSDLLIDLTSARQLSPTAAEAGLGMTLRCAGCRVVISNGRALWTIPAWPVVESIVPNGVAAGAGLRVGDRIASIGGTDVRAMAGASPVAALPATAFAIGFERDGQQLSTVINRRITNQVVINRNVRVRVDRPAGLRARLGSFFVHIGRLIGGEPSPRPAQSP